MIRKSFRKFGALVLGVAAFGSPAKQAQVAQQVQGGQQKDQAGVVAETPQASIERQQRLGRGQHARFIRAGNIWNGMPKKGNRRHRSRWNYNR